MFFRLRRTVRRTHTTICDCCRAVGRENGLSLGNAGEDKLTAVTETFRDSETLRPICSAILRDSAFLQPRRFFGLRAATRATFGRFYVGSVHVPNAQRCVARSKIEVNGMELDYKALSKRLCQMDTAAALIEYIFKTQGGERRRIIPADAAKSVGVSESTICRYLTKLADEKLIMLYGSAGKGNGEVQLSFDILTE